MKKTKVRTKKKQTRKLAPREIELVPGSAFKAPLHPDFTPEPIEIRPPRRFGYHRGLF